MRQLLWLIALRAEELELCMGVRVNSQYITCISTGSWYKTIFLSIDPRFLTIMPVTCESHNCWASG
jgi:hypothetical protein